MLLTELGSSATLVLFLPLSVFPSVYILCLAFSRFHPLRNMRYTLDNMYTDLYTLVAFNLVKYFVAINYSLKFLARVDFFHCDILVTVIHVTKFTYM